MADEQWDVYDELDSVSLGDVRRAIDFVGGPDVTAERLLGAIILVWLIADAPGLTVQQLIDESLGFKNLPWRILS